MGTSKAATLPSNGRQVDVRNDRFGDVTSALFPMHYALIPGLAEFYELELAYLESQALKPAQLVRQGAYFMRIGDQHTDHFRMCSGAPVKTAEDSSEKLKSFFARNIYRTGYASHGLFPYRGKFHPQMIRGLINVLGLRPNDVVLDPMMGSGTTLIEASIMGIRSIGFDTSPFCAMMAKAKVAALVVTKEEFVHSASALLAKLNASTRSGKAPTFNREFILEAMGRVSQATREVVELAYLDAVGYHRRRANALFTKLAGEIFERYAGVIDKFQHGAKDLDLSLSECKVAIGDARHLDLSDDSVDGAIFSPPYSFAIDYLENDAPQLEYLGVNIRGLREDMVGLRGKLLKQRVELYFEDMRTVIAEVSRVLKPRKLAAIIVGSNTRQLSGALDVPEEEVTGIEQHLIDHAHSSGLALRRLIERPIHGLSNTMRQECILILQKS